MAVSVRLADHPAGERVVSPKPSPAGALSTIFTRSTDASLAAVSMRNVGCPVGNVFGLISSCAEAGRAVAVTRTAAPARAAKAERVSIGRLLRVSSGGAAGSDLEREGGRQRGRQARCPH